MGCIMDLYLLSSTCCIHFCSSAALAHMNTLESITGPGWKREQRQSCSGFHTVLHILAELSNFHWLTADFKHVWRMWRVHVQRHDLEGKSREGKNALRDKKRQRWEIYIRDCASDSHVKITVQHNKTQHLWSHHRVSVTKESCVPHLCVLLIYSINKPKLN